MYTIKFNIIHNTDEDNDDIFKGITFNTYSLILNMYSMNAILDNNNKPTLLCNGCGTIDFDDNNVDIKYIASYNYKIKYEDIESDVIPNKTNILKCLNQLVKYNKDTEEFTFGYVHLIITLKDKTKFKYSINNNIITLIRKT